MATQVQFRRGTTAQTALVIGASGEIFVDTTLSTISVQDGVTRGGTYLARQIDLTTGLNKAASNTANVSLIANAAYSQANSANVLAQSAFNSSNTNFTSIQQSLNVISSINTTQNTSITTATNNAASASQYANTGITLAQAAYNSSNTNFTSIQQSFNTVSGIDNTQNTNIIIATNNAASASQYANIGITLAQASFNSSNTNFTSIQQSISQINGVDATQNTNIILVQQLAQAAFNRANTIPTPTSAISGGSF